METVGHEYGGSACHPGEANASFRIAGVYEGDLDAGYQERSTCVTDPAEEAGCVVFDLFDVFDGVPGKLMRRPIKFTPVRSSVDYTRGQAEGHYRRLNRNIVSRNIANHREPLRNAQFKAVADLDGCWHLFFWD